MAAACLLPSWWAHVVAVVSLVLTACQKHGEEGSGALAKVGSSGRAVLAGAPRAILLAWLAGGLLARDVESRLSCAVMLVSLPRAKRREVCACLAVLLARIVACGDGIASLWLPCFLLLQDFLAGEAVSFPQKGPSMGFLSRRRASVCDVSDKVVKRFPNWTAPTHREAKAFANSFNLRGQLLAVYDCTVQLKLQHQGYLYLSRNHICFQAVNLVTRGLQFVIALEDVKEVMSGGSRDVSTLVLKRSVQLKDRHLALSSIVLRGCEAGTGAIAALLDKGDEDDEDECDDSAPEGSLLGAASPASSSDLTSDKVRDTFGSAEPFGSLFEAHIPSLQVGKLAEELLAGTWAPSNLLMQHLEKQGATEVVAAPWIDDTGSGGSTPSSSSPASCPGACVMKLREVTMMMPVPPAPMCPKVTRMTTTFCVKVSSASESEPSIELQTSALSHDVPFGDKFLVQELIRLDPSEGGVSFRKSSRVVFLKSCGLFQSRIRSSSASQCTLTAEMLANLLRGRATPVQRGPGLDQSMSSVDSRSTRDSSLENRTTCTVHVFELQRRVTLWSRNWLPPFLPHDGRKRWRWVDTSYQVHSWTAVTTREAAQASDKPPIAPWKGWAQLSDWAVELPEVEGGDPEGWQYAIDFYHKQRYWGDYPAGCHVRRRIWHCTYVQTVDSSSEDSEGSPAC